MCRVHTSAPTVHIVGVPESAFKFTKGADEVKEFNIIENKYKKFCPTCGTALTQGPKHAKFIGTFPTTYECGANKFPELPDIFMPTGHFNYENAILPNNFKNDGLPKYKTFSKEVGGDGVLMDE